METSKLKVIGIGGTNGSGKDTLGLLLSEHYKYLFVSVTELLRDECNKRGITPGRDNLRKVSAEWRREYGLGVLIDKAVEQFEFSKDTYSGVAIASLRNPGEVEEVHKLGGTVVWLDADPKVRFGRIQKAAAHRSHRAHEDDKTYEEFLAEEEAEMHHSGDEATLNMAGVKELADFHIDNNDESTEAFKKVIDETLRLS